MFCAAAPAIRPLIRAVTGAFGSNPSSNPDYLRYGRYGMGSRSRAGAMELDDGEGFNAMRTKNTFWTKDKQGKAEHSDGESTKGVLDKKQGAEEAGITRTVVIRVDVDTERDDEERGGRDRHSARESDGKTGSSEYL
jgi:hypothetical protein